MKRAWTKKVKMPSSAISKNALEGKLQSQPREKRQIFQTSAAIISLTVSVGTPNLLLVQAAQLPEGVSSQPLPIADSAAPETGQNTQEIVQIQVMPVPVVTINQVTFSPIDRNTAAIPSYKQSNLLRNGAPETNYTSTLPSSHSVEAQTPVVEPTILRQPQQVNSLEQVQALELPATVTTISQKRAIAQLKTSIVSETNEPQILEIVPTQTDANPSLLEVQQAEVAISSEANGAWTAKQRLLINRLKTQANPESSLNQESAKVAVSSEANSAWTAKQRLLINRLKTQANPEYLNNVEAVQVPNNIDLAPVTTSQPMATASIPALPNEGNEAPIAATSNERIEFEAQPLPPEVAGLPTTAPSEQKLVTPSAEVAQLLPVITPTTEPVAPVLKPVFVLPEVSVAPPVDTTATEVEEVEVQQPTAQAIAEELKNSPPAKAEILSVNEPLIVSSTTSEYQVKPGDTLTNIASAHHLSLSEIADFNNLPNPDLLLVDQKIKLPTWTSVKTQTNVAVLPPIKTVPVADISSSSAPTLPSDPRLTLVSTPPAPAYTGVGGSISGAEPEAKPLEQTALNDLQVQYAQKLQNDVQKLKQKYYGQNDRGSIVPAQATQGEVLPVATKLSSNLGDEPVNPEFRVAQTFQDLKPIPQQQSNRVRYSAPATVGGRVATAPANVDNSEEFFSGRQVTPELPPLDPAMNYLPQPNGSIAPFKGYMWPAKGALTSPYGWRWGRMHKGIDIAAPVGTPVFAAAPGVVIKSGWNKGGYGNLVDIQHSDGTLTRYAHNYRILVQPGQFVDQGQQISLMGSTGRSTGPHLHFELHPGGKGAVNPIALLPKAK